LLWKYTLLWFGLALIAVINGTVRNGIYSKATGELRAHQISTVSLLVFIGIYTWSFTRFWELESAGQAWLVGAIWVGITIVFEFVFGHYVVKKTWSTLFHDYNILRGRIWLLVPVWTFFAPTTFFYLNS
jgi:hypothetical protein